MYSKNYFDLAEIFVLQQFKRATNQIIWAVKFTNLYEGHVKVIYVSFEILTPPQKKSLLTFKHFS